METPADQRLLELLDKWLKSLDLHIRYASLDDANYWKIQPWVEHQRPNLWIINLAKQKTVALRKQVQERIKAGDTKFSDSLEMMIFLANLVGSEHIERFIPVADAERENTLTRNTAPPAPRSAPPPPQAPAAAPTPARAAPPPPPAATPPPGIGDTATREMPKFLPPKRGAPPTATAQVARTERKIAAPKSAPRPIPAAKGKASAKAGSDAARDQVIADAARLMQWGRKWYEIAELIARMADRPSLPEVRRIIKDNKPAIDKMSGRD
jgi:hypothetical protein